MTEDWEIVAGNFGTSYKAIKEGLDLSDCTAKIFVWRDSIHLLKTGEENGKACGEVLYDAEENESYCYYDVVEGDFPLTAAVEDIVSYNVMVEFIKDGYKENDLGFNWIVTPAPPE